MRLDNDALYKLYVITENYAKDVRYVELCIHLNTVCRGWELIPQPLV